MSYSRAYNLVLYGATGFTGKLAAEYLASKPEIFHSQFKWAIAGRQVGKLSEIKSGLLEKFPYLAGVGSPDILQADSFDDGALDKVTSNTKALVSFVGPYKRYGTPLVASCVKNNTHYADITGEVTWIRELIDKFQEEAIESKTILIPSSGFDSVPSDWGCWSLANQFKNELGERCGDVTNCIWIMKAGMSGGTAATIFDSNSPQNISASSAMSKDPHYLLPAGRKPSHLQEADVNSPRWNSDLNVWTGPFIMASVNSRNVRHAGYLNEYGPNFTYTEVKRYKSWFKAFTTSWIAFFMGILLRIQLVRPLLAKKLPKPGTGPSEKQMKEGYCQMRFFGRSEKTGTCGVSKLVINGDPGYLMTSKMAVEAGIHLATHAGDKKKFGFMTPSSALGEKYYDELLKNGFEIETKFVAKE